MSLKGIQYGDSLTIPITDLRLSAALMSLDTNRDESVTLADFSFDADPRKAMREAIARNMEMMGLFMYPNQAKGLEKFFATYDKVRSFKTFYDKTLKPQFFPKFSTTLSREWEFDRDTWDKWVKPYFSDGAVFSPKNLTQITYDLSEALLLLSGAPVQTIDEDWPKEALFGNSFESWIYNECAIPEDFRNPFMEFLKVYKESVVHMVRYYSDLECDGEGCPLFGFGDFEISLREKFDSDIESIFILFGSGDFEISLRGVKYFNDFGAAANNILVRTVDQNIFSHFCFTGETYVKLENGDVIFLKDLEEFDQAVLSYEECSDGVRYQPAQKVIHHEEVKATLIRLALKGKEGDTLVLNVTPEHPLLVEKDLGKQWIKAGDLKNGDHLAALSIKDEFVVDSSKTVWEEGVYNLYNLSFSTPNGYLSPTFSVSPDGKHWFFAHTQ